MLIAGLYILHSIMEILRSFRVNFTDRELEDVNYVDYHLLTRQFITCLLFLVSALISDFYCLEKFSVGEVDLMPYLPPIYVFTFFVLCWVQYKREKIIRDKNFGKFWNRKTQAVNTASTTKIRFGLVLVPTKKYLTHQSCNFAESLDKLKKSLREIVNFSHISNHKTMPSVKDQKTEPQPCPQNWVNGSFVF